MRLSRLDTDRIARYIKAEYRGIVEERRQTVISDQDLELELRAVQSLNWRGVQGSRSARWGIKDWEIQERYVRKFPRLAGMLRQMYVDLRLDSHLAEIQDQAAASWYNHWSTVLIENHIGLHPDVIPTLASLKGIDLFYRGIPFDLKVSNFPRNLDYRLYAGNHKKLAVWLYENQSPTRFGANNRIFLVLANRTDISQSWRLKADVGLLKTHLDEFFNSADVSSSDRVNFWFGRRLHKPLAKVVLVSVDS